MTTSTSQLESLLLPVNGFTLIETLVATATAVFVVLAVMTAFSMTSRGFASAGNYSDMQRDARVTLDDLTRDARQATALTAFDSSDISIAVATDFSADGSVTGSKIVRYFRGLGANSNFLY